MGSKYFADTELQCHGEDPAHYEAYGYSEGCGCGGSLGDGIHPQLLELLDAIREKVNIPLTLSCAFRCPEHNRRVKGEPNSFHQRGVAADIQLPDGYTVDEFAQLCRDVMRSLDIEGGIGRYYNSLFVHVDVRGYEAKWSDQD